MGQIACLEKEVVILESNRLLLSPVLSCFFNWGFPDNSCTFGNYATEKVIWDTDLFFFVPYSVIMSLFACPCQDICCVREFMCLGANNVCRLSQPNDRHHCRKQHRGLCVGCGDQQGQSHPPETQTGESACMFLKEIYINILVVTLNFPIIYLLYIYIFSSSFT